MKAFNSPTLAEIITIGDELLIGQTVDTNSAWLGNQLFEIGVQVIQITSISDEPKSITKALDQAQRRADLIILTGGLGPTKDDLTKDVLCEYFESNLVCDEEALNRITDYFKSLNKPILEVNERQALLPDNCESLINNYGTAQGMWFERNNKVFLSLPGIPYEMKGIMLDFGLAKIKNRFNSLPLFKRTVLFHGIAESELADQLSSWQERAQTAGVKIAYLPSPGIVKLRVSASGADAKNLVDNFIPELYKLFPNKIYGEGLLTLPEVVFTNLKNKGLTIATAESCTGGQISRMITAIPGSSEIFVGGIVTYSNKVKTKELNVDPNLIEKFGAVSEHVVTQMAESVRQKMNTDIGVATSGIAGPAGGTEHKPVGTVWISVSTIDQVLTTKFSFGQSRERNVLKASLSALNMVNELLNR